MFLSVPRAMNRMARLMSTSDTFQPLPYKSSTDEFSAVALPSRLKSRPGPGSPFRGIRIAVKGQIFLKGIKASLQSRAFYNTYGPRPETAKCLAALQDGGAHILGTLKMNPFGAWVEPVEYIDYQAPWNPRADGYQSSGGSSTGSAAALAAYEWLDFTLGADSE
jgi:Asp-tRNA(Asn)/Glu-tRNA(Gln) amidotransferase A subunit family amidase